MYAENIEDFQTPEHAADGLACLNHLITTGTVAAVGCLLVFKRLASWGSLPFSPFLAPFAARFEDAARCYDSSSHPPTHAANHCIHMLQRSS